MVKKKKFAHLVSLAALGAAAGLSLSACNKSTSSPEEEDKIQAAIAAFSEQCEASGKVVKVSAECAGTNECAGIDGMTGEAHSCKGEATCGGSVWCEEAGG